MAFSSAPKAFQSLENTHRKQSVSLFLKSLEFYTSSIELSEDGKMGRIYRQPKANMGKMRKKEEKTRQKLRGRFAREGDGLHAQVGGGLSHFFFEKYKGTTPPGWSHPGDMGENCFERKKNKKCTSFDQMKNVDRGIHCTSMH